MNSIPQANATSFFFFLKYKERKKERKKENTEKEKKKFDSNDDDKKEPDPSNAAGPIFLTFLFNAHAINIQTQRSSWHKPIYHSAGLVDPLLYEAYQVLKIKTEPGIGWMDPFSFFCCAILSVEWG